MKIFKAIQTKQENLERTVTALSETLEQERTAIMDVMDIDALGYNQDFDKIEITKHLTQSRTKVESSLQISKVKLEQSQKKTKELKEEQKTFKVYETLQKNLEPRRFEKWLIREVLEELAEGATTHLLTLLQ